MLPPTGTVVPLRFEDLDGKQFERLAFAYHFHTEPAYGFEWYGQLGKDGGRDVVGIGQLSEN